VLQNTDPQARDTLAYEAKTILTKLGFFDFDINTSSMSEGEKKRVAIAQARVTHHHPLSDAAVLGVGHLLRALLAGAGTRTVQALCEDFAARHGAFRFRPYRGRASAYVVDTVQTVLHHFLAHEDFEAALVATVNQGEDADTTGALVGMLAGARCGAQALPRRWLRQLAPAVVQAVTEQASALVALARWPVARPARLQPTA
jgi:ADP-ribosyl-[dinitrogen reductase] hydrolase